MKPILMNHGGKILFAVILLICGGIMASISSETEPESFAQLSADQAKLQQVIADKKVSSAYHFNTENVKALQAFQANAKRLPDSVEAPKYVVYPKPSKPGLDPESLPKSDSERTTYVDVTTGDITELAAKSDHGVVYVTYKLPVLSQKFGDKNVMDVIRVEIFRGPSADKIDPKVPNTVIDYNPEEPLNLDLAKDPVATSTAAPTEDNESIGERRRKHRTEDAPAPVASKSGDKDKKEDVPNEFAGVKAYPDTHVTPKTPYFYKVRLITRLNVEPGKPYPDHMDKDNKPDHFTVYKAPKGLESVAPAKSGSRTLLFAMPLSEAVTATTPAEYEIRLAGTDGTISEPGTRATMVNDNYKGMFVVRVWVTEAQEWRESNITVAKNDTLKGEAHSPSGKKPVNYPFDTKYELEEIKMKPTTREVVERTPRVVDGVQVKDKDTGKPIYDEEKKIVDSVMVKVAVLKELTTGKVEEYAQSNDFKRRDQGIEIIKKLAEQEEKSREEQKKKWEVIRERIKAHESEIKAKAAAAEAEANQLNGGPNGAGGPMGNGGGAPNGPPSGAGGGGPNGPPPPPNGGPGPGSRGGGRGY